MNEPSSISLQWYVKWPVSICVMRNVSLARRARSSVSLMMVCTNCLRLSTPMSESSSTISANPRMAMSGLRKSCATMATNSLFSRSNSWRRWLALLSCSWRRWFSTATLAWPATICSVAQVLVAEGLVVGARSATASRPMICGPARMGVTSRERTADAGPRSPGRRRGSAAASFVRSGPLQAEVPARACVALDRVVQLGHVRGRPGRTPGALRRSSRAARRRRAGRGSSRRAASSPRGA